MRRLWLALVLAGCGGAEPEVVTERVSFRDQSVPIASQVDVEASDIEGGWVIRNSWGQWLGPGWLLTFEENTGYPANDELTGFMGINSPGICTDPGGYCGSVSTGANFAMTGPGRFNFATWGTPDERRAFWILWADADRRTMAIGTPDGSFGFILDREPSGGEDRITAALDIMSWMGYRVDEMEGL